MFENPRRGRQARNFTTNVPKILDLKSSRRTDIFRKLSLDAPDYSQLTNEKLFLLVQGFTSLSSAWKNLGKVGGKFIKGKRKSIYLFFSVGARFS